MSQSISSKGLEQFIKDLMQEGKESSLKGWVMEDILRSVLDLYGSPARDYAYDYIVKNYGPQDERVTWAPI